jgi:hypothetical protein
MVEEKPPIVAVMDMEIAVMAPVEPSIRMARRVLQILEVVVVARAILHMAVPAVLE